MWSFSSKTQKVLDKLGSVCQSPRARETNSPQSKAWGLQDRVELPCPAGLPSSLRAGR